MQRAPLIATGVATIKGSANAASRRSLATTPQDAPPAREVDVDSKGGDATAEEAAPMDPPFSFVQSLPTGGGGDGSAFGSGITSGSLENPDKASTVDKVDGNGLANGFGFSAGSGAAVNNGGEQAGGQGGATAFGQGQLAFEIDDVNTASFASLGATTSDGGAGGFVGFEPLVPRDYGSLFINPFQATTP